MSVTLNPLSVQNFTDRRLIEESGSYAANAGASALVTIAVPRNKQVIIRGIVRASAGAGPGAPVAVTVDATANTLTSAAHAFVSGQPVIVSAAVLPTGFSANTVYYLGVTSTTVGKLYDTKANAVTNNGVTGLIDPTTAGTTVVIIPTTENAVYTITAMIRNRESTITEVGAESVVSLEDVSAWDLTWVIDNSAKTAVLKFTPDPTLASRATAYLEVIETSV
jgi:hypothetical protein